MNKTTCLKLAKQLYGPRAEIRDRKEYKAERRQQASDRLAAIKVELDAARKELESLKGSAEELLNAARFVCDVNGDYPSVDQLRQAVEKANRASELSDSISQLNAERRSNVGKSLAYRLEVAVLHSGPFPHYSIEATADDYAELESKLLAKLNASSWLRLLPN
jgi:benzoyl-CoA reductase/2-hydroxyglutaryl-CoA dehydratase subunit BcrC/BadD/HgdB